MGGISTSIELTLKMCLGAQVERRAKSKRDKIVLNNFTDFSRGVFGPFIGTINPNGK